MEDKLLSVQDLTVKFTTKSGEVEAVSHVSFDMRKGEVFALIGESGCGKSTTATSVMRLIKPPGTISGGSVFFEGRDLLQMSRAEMTKVRGKDIGMIFQNPLDSLNPVYSIGDQVIEGLVADKISRAQAWEIARDVFRDVKISDVEKRMRSYPHEISGGMRQRVMIGMMICRNPKLLIADEPTTALDVTIQAEIIELMNELRKKYNTAILIITHDFGIVAEMADRVGVMYAGKLVELGDVFTIFDKPSHPYTQLLMRALPKITKDEGRLETIKGFVPDLTDLKAGCRFAERCPYKRDCCVERDPILTEIAPGHFSACFLADRAEN